MQTVIFITPSLNGGGAERVMSVLANYLDKKDYNIKFVLTKNKNIEYQLRKGIVVDYNPFGTSALNQIKYIREQMKKNKEAIFISFFTYQNMYTLLSNIGLCRKIIISERNDPSKTLYGKNYLNPIRNVLYSTAFKIVFQTPGAKNFFPKVIQSRSEIIVNPLKDGLPDRYEGIRRKEIVTFARLEPQKNYPLLIEAFESFSKTHPEYTLAIYGKGAMESGLKNLVTKKQLDHKVKFCGFNSALHEIVRDAAMFVLPSDYEGLSNSMLEAMAIGLPCICTDCPPGGARMFINNGENGMLVPVKDADAMCEAMIKIAEDPNFALKLSRNASKIRNELQYDVICKKWEEIIHDC